ncbi:MAG: glycosyltransferase family 9 protein [Acidobacteria bacterium]|nr:glycosyltransferase family 9 protein [Acidobacteriota bacterium]
MRFDLNSLTSPVLVVRCFEPVFRLMGMRTHSVERVSNARRILVIRNDDKIGDLILFTPFLRELRRNAKDAEITVLIHPAIEPLLRHCPYVDHVLTYARWTPRAFGQVRRMFHEIAWARKFLWPKRFDIALVTRSHHRVYREGALAFLSGAPVRAAVCSDQTTVGKDEPDEALFYNRVTPSQPDDHEVQRNLSLLPFAGGAVCETKPELWLTDEERSEAELVAPADPERPTRVAMMAGSSVPGRRWPAERFARVAAWMTGEYGWQVVLIGSSADAGAAKRVEEACPNGVVNLTGRTSLRQTMAVLAECRLYVGNDTGPMHMAAALGVPVVEISCHPEGGDLFNERSPARFGPFGVPAWVARPPATDGCRDFCHPGEEGEAHCILGVTVEDVIGLVREAATALSLAM